MKTPKFWYDNKSFYFLLFYPLSLVWMLLSYIKKIAVYSNNYKVPIVCVGNIIAGGAGKTPLSIEIAKLFKKKNVNAHLIYKSFNKYFRKSVAEVTKKDLSFELGDEVILASKSAKTWVCKKRHYGIKEAEKKGADIIILDDGMQDYTIKKDFTILVINSAQMFGNNCIIPAGPLRESIYSGVLKSDCIFFYGNKRQFKRLLPFYKKNVYFPSIVVCRDTLKKLKNKKIVAFAGIAHPSNFYNTLKNNGLKLIKYYSFSDHHFYKINEINEIINYANSNNAAIVTTEKDYVKLSRKYQKRIEVMPISINFNYAHFLNTIKENIYDKC